MGGGGEVPGDFARDTAVDGSGGRYLARLSPDWEVWGPFGGYVAAIALRALGAESALPRPASFACAFLSVARFGEVTLEVESLRRGKRSEALAVRMRQGDAPVLTGFGWVVDAGMSGLEHDHAEMPDVPTPGALRSYEQLSANYAEWYPLWRTIDGRPVRWSESPEPGPPRWHTWMRLRETPPLDDPFLDAARTLMWLDMAMWNATVGPHVPWPVSHLAPSLDLSAVFHAGGEDAEWLLSDGHAPVGREGLVGCNGRVWTPDGRLVGSATSTLLCRPNPEAAG
jgi:acyl-CoA thioesterase